jgi:hypothetical protein
MSKFPKGSRVAWSYTHATNSRTRFKRTKYGTVHHDCKESGILNGLVAVQFDGNKTRRLSLDNKIKRRIIRGKITIKLSISSSERT